MTSSLYAYFFWPYDLLFSTCFLFSDGPYWWLGVFFDSCAVLRIYRTNKNYRISFLARY